MNTNDKVEVSNNEIWNNNDIGWLFLAYSEGYNMCMNEYTGIYANFRYVRSIYTDQINEQIWILEHEIGRYM